MCIRASIYAALSELASANEPYYKHRLDSLQQIIAQTDPEVDVYKRQLTESQHIFIDMGLKHSPVSEPHILEIGLGLSLIHI